jgi:hypothetical protein
MGICKCDEGNCSVHISRKHVKETIKKITKKFKKEKNIPEYEVKNACECSNCECDDHDSCDCDDCECVECSC